MYYYFIFPLDITKTRCLCFGVVPITTNPLNLVCNIPVYSHVLCVSNVNRSYLQREGNTARQQTFLPQKQAVIHVKMNFIPVYINMAFETKLQ